MASSPWQCRGWVVVNGVVQRQKGGNGNGNGIIPPVGAFLQAHQGAYTTTRTQSHSLLLFWDRHLARLHHSVRILSQEAPHLLGLSNPSSSSSSSFAPSLHRSLLTARALLSDLPATDEEEELALTALVTASPSPPSLHVLLHLSFYAPPPFPSSPARLALAGPPRPLPAAKYSHWATLRKRFQPLSLRSPHATEFLLTPDGDQLLEGSVTNFFVVSKVTPSPSPSPSPCFAAQLLLSLQNFSCLTPLLLKINILHPLTLYKCKQLPSNKGFFLELYVN